MILTKYVKRLGFVENVDMSLAKTACDHNKCLKNKRNKKFFDGNTVAIHFQAAGKRKLIVNQCKNQELWRKIFHG